MRNLNPAFTSYRLTQASSRFLEGLCDYLYDDLRPRILHEPKLGVLCEVCTVIQALMVLDLSGDYDDFEPSSQPDNDHLSPLDTLKTPISPTLRDLKSAHSDPALKSDIVRNNRIRKHQQLKHLHIGNLLEMVLQDAQTRLVFKAQAVIQSEIRYYVAKDGDLDYPQKLIGEHLPRFSSVKSTESSHQSFARMAPKEPLSSSAPPTIHCRESLLCHGSPHGILR